MRKHPHLFELNSLRRAGKGCAIRTVSRFGKTGKYVAVCDVDPDGRMTTPAVVEFHGISRPGEVIPHKAAATLVVDVRHRRAEMATFGLSCVVALVTRTDDGGICLAYRVRDELGECTDHVPDTDGFRVDDPSSIDSWGEARRKARLSLEMRYRSVDRRDGVAVSGSPAPVSREMLSRAFAS